MERRFLLKSSRVKVAERAGLMGDLMSASMSDQLGASMRELMGEPKSEPMVELTGDRQKFSCRSCSRPFSRRGLDLYRIGVLAALLVSSLVVSCPAIAQGSPAPRTVTVKSGDTLEGIAQRYRVSVGDLKRLNGLKDADLLQVGQTLRLPSPPRKGVVVVKSGDTLETIAKAHHTTVAALQKANPGLQPTMLKVGSTLRIPSSGPQAGAAAKPPTPSAAAKPPTPGAAAPAKTSAPSAAAKPPTPAPPSATAAASTPPPPPQEPDSPLLPDSTGMTSRGRWRYFGDTVVDWGGWKRLPDGVRYTLVQPALKDVGETRAQATAIGVDCATLRHTWRVKEAWESWSIPAPRSVGQQIVLDLCGNAVGDERRPVPAPPSPSP